MKPLVAIGLEVVSQAAVGGVYPVTIVALEVEALVIHFEHN